MAVPPQAWLLLGATLLGLIVTAALLRSGGHSTLRLLILTLIFIALGVFGILQICGFLIAFVAPLLPGVD
jgi:hypothetical protein